MKLVKIVSVVLIATFVSIAAFAHNNVVVIPLGGGEFKPLDNIVTVSPANADFTNINAAVASITDASASNPYLIVVGPGIYTVSPHVVMKPYVSISGSGIKETTIKGSITGGAIGNYANNGVVLLASNTTLSDLTVENTAVTTSDSYIVGIMAYQVTEYSALVKNVSVMVAGSASDSSRGIYSEACSIIVEDSHISVNGTMQNYGARNRNSNTIMRNTVVEVSGGTSNRAIYDSGAAATASKFVELDQVTVSATGSAAVGVYVSSDAVQKIRQSKIHGDTASIDESGSTDVNVSHSTLTGGNVSGSGSDYVCTFNDNGAGAVLGSGCLP